MSFREEIIQADIERVRLSSHRALSFRKTRINYLCSSLTDAPSGLWEKGKDGYFVRVTSEFARKMAKKSTYAWRRRFSK